MSNLDLYSRRLCSFVFRHKNTERISMLFPIGRLDVTYEGSIY